MVAKTRVAAGVLLFAAISAPAPAQAQNWKCRPGCDERKGRPCPLYCLPTPPRPQPVNPQQVYPQFVYPPFVGLCVVIDVGTCQVFRAPGSYCECKNWLGEVFSGIVQ